MTDKIHDAASVPAPSMRFTFSARLRLTKNGEFENVFQRRLSVSDGRLILYAAANNLGYSRLGLCVTKKFGNAVHRNRFKRLLREAFRLNRHCLPAGFDFVVLPRRKPLASFWAYQKSLGILAAKISQRHG